MQHTHSSEKAVPDVHNSKKNKQKKKTWRFYSEKCLKFKVTFSIN